MNDIGEAYHGPWYVIRDFNAIISASEKKRGLHFASSNKGRMDKVIEDFSLIDLGFGGNNSCGITNIQERLDRDIVHATAGVSYFLKLLLLTSKLFVLIIIPFFSIQILLLIGLPSFWV